MAAAAKPARPKKAATRPTPTRPGAAPASAAAEPSAPPSGGAASLDQWLHDIARPRTLTVFDQDWSVKAPTGALAVRWDVAMHGKGIGSALALMMADETPLQEGGEPGSARALEFIATAETRVPIDQAQEFWLRIEAALFPGEAVAS